MRAGDLNRRVTIQRRTEAPTGTGGTAITWPDVATVWANIRYLSGIETVRADFPVSVAKASIRIRRRTDVDETCRVLHGEKVFDIKAVLFDETGREYVDLACEAGRNNG